MKLNIVSLIVLSAVGGLFAQDVPPIDPIPLPIPLPPLKSVTFSFASDDHHAGPTFTITGGNIISAKAPVDLMVDLNNHTNGGQVTFQALLILEGQLMKHQVCTVSLPTTIGFVHTWVIKPTVLRFDHIAPGTLLPPDLLEIKSDYLIFQAVSTSPTFIMDAANITIHERLAPNILFIPGPRMVGIGVNPTNIQYNEDVAFTLTNIKRIVPGGVFFSAPIAIDAAGNFLADFVAEGSFSASADGL